MRLDSLVSVLRSKNAGPLTLTIDLIFPDEATFSRVALAKERLRAEVSRLYGEPAERVAVHLYPPALAIKIALPRRVISGDLGDRDVYGAQQHAPLLGIEL
jgi:hypothetical protein